MSNAICPNCNFPLKKTPLRKTACKNCGKIIYVANDESTVQLLKEDEYVKYQERRKEKYLVKKFLKDLEYQTGKGIKEFEEAREIFRQKNGFYPNGRDVLWGLFNSAVISTRDLNNLSMLYSTMARFLHEEGRDHLAAAQQSMIMTLKHYQKEKIVDKVEILGSGVSCEACKPLNGKILTIAEALASMPIPCPNCSNEATSTGRGWCRCIYAAVID